MPPRPRPSCVPSPPASSRRPAGRSSRRGVTLLEALVVVAIAGVLVSLGAPSMTRTIDRAAVLAPARELASALRFARAEAVRRGAWVTVCARSPAAGPIDCAGSAGDGWRAGWLVFVDDGQRGRFDDADQLLRVQPALAHSAGADGTMAALTYGPGGTSIDAASHVLFRTASADIVQLVCVAKTGRPRLAPAGQRAC